ncbi:MAG: nucleotide exchange factor GrpE [Candidatus Omnitrophica bacterium 4484_70.2]|nr:MAG: nucleotide exchange factor GrpE [Candidatus Omnitrophica bacterium 4484_70.2]
MKEEERLEVEQEKEDNLKGEFKEKKENVEKKQEDKTEALYKENSSLAAEEKESKEEIEKIKEKAKEYDVLWDKYLRICADFDNARKRWEREKEEMVKFGNFQLIRDLVVILDEFEHAMETMKTVDLDEKIVKGIKMIYSKLWDILHKNGLTPIEVKNKRFDPYLCEIVGQRELEDIEEPIVVGEVQKGYMLRERVLRTSKVVVGIKKTEQKVKNQGGEEGVEKSN